MMKFYQDGGSIQQINQPTNNQGNQNNQMMQLFQAFFQMNGMNEQEQQQFLQEFQQISPQEQQQVIEYITQQIQSGNQEMSSQPQNQVNQVGSYYMTRFDNRDYSVLQTGANYSGDDSPEYLESVYSKPIGMNYENIVFPEEVDWHGKPPQAETNVQVVNQPQRTLQPKVINQDDNGTVIEYGDKLYYHKGSNPHIGALLDNSHYTRIKDNTSNVPTKKVSITESNKVASTPLSQQTPKQQLVAKTANNEVMEFQKYLQEQTGINVGKLDKNGKATKNVDGIFGDKTYEAAKTLYEKQNGVVDGKLPDGSQVTNSKINNWLNQYFEHVKIPQKFLVNLDIPKNETYIDSKTEKEMLPEVTGTKSRNIGTTQRIFTATDSKSNTITPKYEYADKYNVNFNRNDIKRESTRATSEFKGRVSDRYQDLGDNGLGQNYVYDPVNKSFMYRDKFTGKYSPITDEYTKKMLNKKIK